MAASQYGSSTAKRLALSIVAASTTWMLPVWLVSSVDSVGPRAHQGIGVAVNVGPMTLGELFQLLVDILLVHAVNEVAHPSPPVGCRHPEWLSDDATNPALH